MLNEIVRFAILKECNVKILIIEIVAPKTSFSHMILWHSSIHSGN